MPCPEKRLDRRLTLELAAQFVVVHRTTRNAPTKKLPLPAPVLSLTERA